MTSDVDRAQRLAFRLTRQQLEAIAKDTRLPGEIGGAYGVSASVIIRIQKMARGKLPAAHVTRHNARLASTDDPTDDARGLD